MPGQTLLYKMWKLNYRFVYARNKGEIDLHYLPVQVYVHNTSFYNSKAHA